MKQKPKLKLTIMNLAMFCSVLLDYIAKKVVARQEGNAYYICIIQIYDMMMMCR